MKLLLIALGIALALETCQSDSIAPKKLIGKWDPTYQIQNKESDGSWSPWKTINTFVALPSIEFTANGEFLSDDKPGAQCCYAGNKYTVTDNTIEFSEFKSCPEVRCMDCTKWLINRLDSDTLVVEVCNGRSKYVRGK